ncbi:MAG: pyrroline-5-carboxylate reductase [Candidatus Binataceae bacterium]|jgi:pyrroline-5-carboxylate reductase
MKKLGFIGAGNMAEALARGLLAKKLFRPSELIASDVEPARRRKLARLLKIETAADNIAVVNQARAIVLAVKPQTIDAVLDEIAPALNSSVKGKRASGDKLFISIAAGVPISRIESHLGGIARVIRVMPNAPAMVGQGMAAIVGGSHTSRTDEAFTLRIFRAAGEAVILREESLLDAVTALSGSGPAYVYLFVQAMVEAAVKEGLPGGLALQMALQTVRGAEQTMRQSRMAPSELIRIVASPGGTTLAALTKFAEASFSDVIAGAIHAAADRSRELGRSR